jgi:hypothetical protein
MKITFDSLPERTFRGRVSFRSREAEFTPSNVQTPDERSQQVFRIKIELDQSDDTVYPGMTADVWLE